MIKSRGRLYVCAWRSFRCEADNLTRACAARRVASWHQPCDLFETATQSRRRMDAQLSGRRAWRESFLRPLYSRDDFGILIGWPSDDVTTTWKWQKRSRYDRHLVFSMLCIVHEECNIYIYSRVWITRDVEMLIHSLCTLGDGCFNLLITYC